MDLETRKEYARLRKAGFGASQAARGARINVAFGRAAKAGLVRLDAIEDCEAYDDSYIDTWTDQAESVRAKARKETRARVESEGTCGVRTYAMGACGKLHEVDSCWGFIGDDWRDSGYDHDLKRAALDALRSAL